MKVKNYIWGAFVALATLAGCDEVDEQDRFISMGDVEVKRNVFVGGLHRAGLLQLSYGP